MVLMDILYVKTFSNGYLGVRYDDCNKYILSESLEMLNQIWNLFIQKLLGNNVIVSKKIIKIIVFCKAKKNMAFSNIFLKKYYSKIKSSV